MTSLKELFDAALEKCTDPKTRKIWVDKNLMSQVYTLCGEDKRESVVFGASFSRWLKQHYTSFPPVYFTDAKLKQCVKNIQNAVLPMVASPTDPQVERWLAASKSGNEIVYHFAFEEMCNTRTSGIGYAHPSANQLFANDDDRLALVKSMFRCRKDENLTAANLRNAAKFRHVLPSNFAPLLMKTVIDQVAASSSPSSGAVSSTSTTTSNLSVLDPCAGWGHRFVGFWASRNATHYVGFDPNENLHASTYPPMAAFFNSLDSNATVQKTYQFVCKQAESSDFCTIAQQANNGRLYDLVMTCPPYFNVERYANDAATQSHVCYPTYQQWVERFLAPMMLNASTCLRPGGLFAIVVRDGTNCETLCADTCTIATARCELETYRTIHLCKSVKTACQPHEYFYIFKKK
jgi:tRNA1(Val) A37 N6-methylase TrmN6